MNRRSITKLPRHFCGRTGTAQERGDVRARTAAMRVCQPGPLAFQRASVSGAIRRLMATLAFGDFGRPRGFSRRAAAFLPTILGSTSAAGRARLKSAAVHSGFSSSINSGLGLRFIASYLSGVGSAQTDDVDLAGAEREYQHMQPVVNKAQRLETLFSVIPARIFQYQGAGPVKIRRPCERQTAPGDVPRILSGVETDLHVFNVYAYIQKIKWNLPCALARHKLVGPECDSGASHNRRHEKLQ